MKEHIDSGEVVKNENDVDNAETVVEECGGSISAADLRNASYFVLFIAAIFVVNAMETGSYRTPWPVAIIVSLAGLGLYGYSFIGKKEERK